MSHPIHLHPLTLSLSKGCPFFPRPYEEGRGFDKLSPDEIGPAMDASPATAYLPRRMERSVKLLLTLLVLLSGLAAVPAPARASAGGSGIEQVVVPLADGRVVRAPAVAASSAAGKDRGRRVALPPPARQPVVAPAVREGDRALE